MKSIFLFIFAAVVLTACANESGGECSLEQSFRCFQECKLKGHHSSCEYGSCSCTSCYFRACKGKCARQGKIGQCQDDYCTCLA